MPELQRKIRQYQRLKKLLPALENQIKAEGTAIMRTEGLLGAPRIERIIDRFAA